MQLLRLLILLFLKYVVSSPSLEVNTPLGKILGSTLTTRLGKTIYAFRGIRYAKPPINELRFKPPVPVDRWSGVYNATVDGPVCPQPSNDPVSEDCLLLNVYSTKLPKHGRNPKRPVIIFLHSGAFFSGTGRSNVAGPQYFMDQDIVLVTINNRLGSLGFISMGKEAPGNNGLRDQVIAMKWVKNNIESFGGDPGAVTLFGYSAGAWSITLHMVSPMSRGLFHKAIISSGSTLGYTILPRSQPDLAKKQARFVGCPDTSPKEILDCLKTVPAEKLGNSLPQFATFGDYLLLVWTPVVEEDFGQERFLTDNPVKLFANGNFEKIPVVGGMTKDEFGFVQYFVFQNETFVREFNENFYEIAPAYIGYEAGTNRSREITRSIRRFYLNDQPISNATLPGLARISIDTLGFGVDRTLRLISEKSSKPAYDYQFTYQGRYSYIYRPESNGTVPFGVVHHDDLIYLFYNEPLFPFFNSSFPESEMVDTLTSLWANFAKTGNPICHSRNQFKGVEWLPYNVNTKKYLEIGKSLVLKENLNEKAYAFWEKLFPTSSYL